MHMRCDVLSPAGDALKSERQEKAGLQAAAVSLKSRIANMAATREAHNKQLTGQIDKLRAQLDKSKKVQHESQHQVSPESVALVIVLSYMTHCSRCWCVLMQASAVSTLPCSV